MNKMQRGGYIPTAQAKAGAKALKKKQNAASRAGNVSIPLGPRPTSTATAKRLAKQKRGAAKIQRRNSRSIQRRLVKVK